MTNVALRDHLRLRFDLTGQKTLCPVSCCEQFEYLCRCWCCPRVFFQFFSSSENMCLRDNILGIETTLACLADCKKILISCSSQATFTRKTLLLTAPDMSTAQHKVFKIEDLSCSIWQIFRRICCRRNQFWHFLSQYFVLTCKTVQNDFSTNLFKKITVKTLWMLENLHI